MGFQNADCKTGYNIFIIIQHHHEDKIHQIIHIYLIMIIKKKKTPKGFRISWGIEHLRMKENHFSLLQSKIFP